MNFVTSTHKRDWLFDADTLKQRYAQAQQQAVQTLQSQRAPDGAAPPDAKKPRGDSPITLEEEALLRLYWQQNMKQLCSSLQPPLPSKVLNAALLYFKRFFSQASCVEHDAMRVMATCVYLACKVEEVYHSADKISTPCGYEKPAPVLSFEVPLLQGLKFDLVVHSAYRALAGLFKELDQLRAAQSPALDPPLLSAPSEALSAAHAKARAAVDVLMLTDAPLLYPPGLLAVAALRSGFRSVSLSTQQYLRHVAAKAAAVAVAVAAGSGTESAAAAGAAAAAPSPPEVVEQQHQQLLASLAAIDQLAAAQAGGMNEAAVKAKAAEIDRRLKLWKKELLAGKKEKAAAAAVGT